MYFVRFVQRHDKKGEFKQQENGRKSGGKPFFRTNPAVLQAKKSRRRLFYGSAGGIDDLDEKKKPVLRFSGSLKAACAWLPAVSAVFVF
ncbi:hypothetical protein [Neisseria bacilliformis]|uniref:hypothetical protein n=1 Tax=Neisseria bacilliformis TaxID=267212 RepID=UPI00128C5797|nr:hypothetical protein [Neisseria bacilliformis]